MALKVYKKYILSLIFVLVISMGFAQQRGPSNPPGNPEVGPPLGGGAPIDGGLGILLALGAAYGLKKVHNIKTSVNDDKD